MKYTHQQSRSLQAVVLPWIMRMMGAKKMVGRDFEKAFHNRAEIPANFSSKFNVENRKIDENVVWTLSPKSGQTNKTILFIHGGAYLYGINKNYWDFIGELVSQTKAKVIVPDYPLAPEHTAAQVYPLIEKVYQSVIAQTAPKNVILLGDSAGGGLSFGFTHHLKNNNQPLPAQLILLSPWLDVGLMNPAIKPIENKDPQLEVTSLQTVGKAYAGKWALDDYRVSPIYGQLKGLPPVSVFIGTHDIFYADTEKLSKKFEKEKIDVNYFVYPKLFHDWLLLPKMKESQNTFKQIVELINRK